MNREEFIYKLKKDGININNSQLEKLEIYKKFLQSENKKYNLTSIVDDNDIYYKHFYDSIIIMKYYNFNDINSLCDVGTGAGFPGMILKIMNPNLKVTLLDSQNKKIEFLKQLGKLLKIDNIQFISDRIENIKFSYDVVIARAVGSISYLTEISYNLYNKEIILMRGKDEEISENLIKELHLEIKKDKKYFLGNNSDSRRILVFKKKKLLVSKKYPRANAIIKKNNL